MAHGMGKPAHEEPAILVVDIGGGTCDISLLQSFEGLLEVVGYDGDSQLGGVDLDEAILQHWSTWDLPFSAYSPSVIQRRSDVSPVLRMLLAAVSIQCDSHFHCCIQQRLVRSVQLQRFAIRSAVWQSVCVCLLCWMDCRHRGR